MPNLSENSGGSGASRTRRTRGYVPHRTGWAFHMPNATLAVGAGLEPAHALRREPRFQRGAIPFRSPYRLNKRSSRHGASASEQRAAAACDAGGDDPIRTDGALRGHSALAVRRLRPLGHVSLDALVGMERFELSCAMALVSKTSVSSISTTSPRLSNYFQPGHTPSYQVSGYKPVDKWRAPVDSNPEGVTALEAAASANSARKRAKMKSPSNFEGLLRFQELFLNQPHPSMLSKSLSDSDRYELDKFFTKMRIPQLSIKRN